MKHLSPAFIFSVFMTVIAGVVYAHTEFFSQARASQEFRRVHKRIDVLDRRIDEIDRNSLETKKLLCIAAIELNPDKARDICAR